MRQPEPWPEDCLQQTETLGLIRAAIDRLPGLRRQVILLRDVEGWTGAEVCELLGITEANQRVLLHRARSSVRAELEQHLAN
jgi:RNA polymerase sigma-70 factor (ECF subfamily)